MEEVKYRMLSDTATEPTKGSGRAGGWDLYADLKGEARQAIQVGETVKIGTGLSAEIPCYAFGAIYARSGLATKSGIRPANCVGVIDADYRGEIIIALHNDGDSPFIVEHGMRIAQIIIQPYVPVKWTKAESLSETERGEGGFGSTGTK